MLLNTFHQLVGIGLFLFKRKMVVWGRYVRILHASLCLCVGQRKTCANQFSPHHWGLLGMALGAFSHWAPHSPVSGFLPVLWMGPLHTWEQVCICMNTDFCHPQCRTVSQGTCISTFLKSSFSDHFPHESLSLLISPCCWPDTTCCLSSRWLAASWVWSGTCYGSDLCFSVLLAFKQLRGE